jgi:hypothetical protein
MTLHVERIPVVVKQGFAIAFGSYRPASTIQSINHAAILKPNRVPQTNPAHAGIRNSSLSFSSLMCLRRAA